MEFKKLLLRLLAKIKQAFRLRAAHGGGKYWVGRGAFISATSKIGAWTYIQKQSYIGYGVRIGRYCAIARNVEIGPTHHDYNLVTSHEFPTHRKRFDGVVGNMSANWKPTRTAKRSPTILENDVWIGTKATVLRGVRVGTGAVVAAHAVVTKDVPPYAIVGGVPAKIIRYRFPEETIKALLDSQWWLLDPADLDAFNLTKPAESAKAILERTHSMRADD